MVSVIGTDPMQRTARFLSAWKRGVILAGDHYFQVTVSDIVEATHRDQLRPDYARIEHALGSVSAGQGAFLAAMYSFFNADDGQRLLTRAGYPNICDVAAKLDGVHAEIIASLFLNYHGW